MATTLEHEYLTVAEAAASLRVDRSTVRRWIDQGTLPAYRVGQRSLRIRRDDLEKMVTPAQPSAAWAAELARLKAKRLTPEERDRALAAMEDARAFREEVLARREENCSVLPGRFSMSFETSEANSSSDLY